MEALDVLVGLDRIVFDVPALSHWDHKTTHTPPTFSHRLISRGSCNVD